MHHGFLLTNPQKKKNLVGKKKEGKGRNGIRKHWSDRISSTCNQARMEHFGVKVKSVGLRVLRINPSKFGSDRWSD